MLSLSPSDRGSASAAERLVAQPPQAESAAEPANPIFAPEQQEPGTLPIVEPLVLDTLPARPDSLKTDSLGRKPFLDDIIKGTNQDSLIYDLRTKNIYIFEKGDITYQKMNIKGDYMRINMTTKEVFAHGRPDTTKTSETAQQEIWDQEISDSIPKNTRVEFSDGSQSFTMDTMIYNLGSKKARVQGVATHEGEGYLLGERVKMMPDKTVNIARGRYTTCDADHPHFYLAMTKSSTIPGKKTVFGPAYVVMEDVPIYFLGLPFGFFPMTAGRKSGFLTPTIGEEMRKGFFLRDGGYYFAINDYLDLAATGSIYTLGSWQAQLASRYVKKYRYSGNLRVDYSNDKVGEKGDDDYYAGKNFSVEWSHSQDAKFKPNTTFSASVKFSTSGYDKYSTTDLNNYISSQTNSSIAFSKNWVGTPFSFSTNFQHSQSRADTSVQLTFPNIVFSASRITPFKRKTAVGKPKWYEKISLSYNMNLTNSIKAKEKDLFTSNTLKNMVNGISHKIPVTTSFNLFKYFTFTPSFNYSENWFFRKVNQAWDPVEKKTYNSDTTYGFYRLYDYAMSVSATTKVYGTYQFKKKDGLIRAIRHMLTPTASFNYTPDFGTTKFGYYSQVQSDTLGNMKTYSPYSGNAYNVPGSGPSMNISFGLSQTLEMKVRDRQDTTGMRKIKVIDQFNISSSYNFLAEQFNLAPFNLSLRTTLYKNVALNINATLDPYAIDEKGTRINRFMLKDGKLGRITSASTSFGYSFNSSSRSNQAPAMNDINSAPDFSTQMDMFSQPGFSALDPAAQRLMMTSRYYDFSMPWNLGVNYSFSYSKPGLTSRVTQTLGFNGSVTVTEKWGVTLSGGYDVQTKKLTPGAITVTRDLHCWQMSFRWIPTGWMQSWSFNISVKASTLRDLKYDRSRSHYDSLYDE